MSIINKGKTFSNGEQLTAEKLNDLVDLAAFDQSATDSASTTVNTSGQIVVKDGGVSTPKIADTAVTTAKIADGQVTPAKLSTGAPTWDTSGAILTSGDSIEINYDLVGDDDAHVDFHSTSASNPDYDARIHKVTGENSVFKLENKGSGETRIFQDDKLKYQATSASSNLLSNAYSDSRISCFDSSSSFLPSGIQYTANTHSFKNIGQDGTSTILMNMTDDGNAELQIESNDATGEANLALSSFTPSIIFQDKSTSAKDFQIQANGNSLNILSGDTSGDAPLTNEIVKIKSTDEVEIKGNLLINNVVDKPAILIEDTDSGTVDSEGEIAVPVGESFSLGFWDAAAAVGSRFISKLRFDSSWIYLRSKLRIGGTTDDSTDPVVYIDGIRETTTDELRLSADKLTFYTDTNYATKVIDATPTKVSIDLPLEVSTISGPESANVLILRADPESPDPTNGGAQISLHSSDSSVPNQIYNRSAFTYFQNMSGATVASIGSSGPTAAKDLATKEYVDNRGVFTPSTYNGEESVTLPNNLIMKMGSTTSKTVNYGTAFPGGCVSVTITHRNPYSDFNGNASFVDSSSLSGFTISSGRIASASGSWFWQAIGY